ncbi:hypothetical protein LINPERHAP1_LOCUS16882 [Linum perenne]
MCGVIEGLIRTWDASYQMVVLKLDSRAANMLLTNGDETTNHHAMKKLQFQELMDRDWSLRTELTYREGNRAAAFLAGIDFSYYFGSHTFAVLDCRLGYF